MEFPLLAARELATHRRSPHRLEPLGLGTRFRHAPARRTMNVLIEVEPQIWRDALSHLLDHDPAREQAAFLFAREAVREQTRFLTIFGARHIEARELAFHSSYHLELKEETWSAVIKEAHQQSAALIELHSHIGGYPAEFSPSDIGGLK